MSAADSYMPDQNVLDAGQNITQQAQQLPDNSAPPQAPPATQPPAQPADVATPSQPADNPNTHSWRAVLTGALQGLESHFKGAGEGLVAGGIPGALVGAVNPALADSALKNQQALATAHVQQAQAQAQSATQDTAFQAQNHDLQLASAQIHIQQLRAIANNTPADFQEHLQQEGAEAGQHLIDSGITPVFSGNEADAQAQLKARMQVRSDSPLNVTALPDGKGGFNVFEIPNADKTYDHAVELTIGYTADGQPIKKTYTAGSISIARGLNLESAAMVDESKNQAKIALQQKKNEGSADVANIRAKAQAGTASFGQLAPLLVSGQLSPMDVSTRGNLRGLAVAAADRLSKANGGAGFNAIEAENTAAAQKNVQKDFTSGQAAKNLNAISTANDHLDRLSGLIAPLDNGDAQFVNKVGNSISQAFGGTAPTNFEAVKEAVSNEVAKAFAGSGGTALADRQEASQILSKVQSPAQIRGAITQLRGLMQSKSDALKHQYTSGMQGQPAFVNSANPFRKGK